MRTSFRQARDGLVKEIVRPNMVRLKNIFGFKTPSLENKSENYKL